MVRGPAPAARLSQNLDPEATRGKSGSRPDVVEPSSAVVGLPVARPIAPPGIELMVRGNVLPEEVDPASSLLRFDEPRGLGWRVAHDLEQLAMRPDVVLERRHVEVTDGNRMMACRNRAVREPAFELVEEAQLMREFGVALGGGFIAACRYIKIV